MDNRVRISASNEEAMKILWGEIQRYYNFQLEKTEQEMRFSVDLNAEVFTELVKAFTKNNKMHLLQFQFGEEETKVEDKTEVKPEAEESAEEDEEEEVWFKDRKPKKRIGSLINMIAGEEAN